MALTRTARSARMVRRVSRVDEDGWTYTADGKRVVRIGTWHRLGTCAYCNEQVADRTKVGPDERECACEVCRAKA